MTSSVLKKIKRYRIIYIMLIPIVIYFVVFSYYPLYLGIKSSLMESKLIGGGKFVGFDNYLKVLKDSMYAQALVNTLVVGIGTFVLQFVLGLMLAVGINEVKNKVFKASVQSVTYLPYLLSWSVVGGMWITMLSATGIFNAIVQTIAGPAYHPMVFMAEAKFAREIMILTGAWKGAGYYAVLFMAAIVSIDPSIYEAAAIDGASRFKQIIFIMVPNLSSTMKVILVLGSMSVLRNFDQIFIMGNSSIYDEVRNLLYLIYKNGITEFKVGIATAGATLLLILTFIISYIVRKLTKYDESY